jgi:hypothetical protein
MQLPFTQFSPVSCYFLPLRPKQSAAGLLRSSADHRPSAPIPVPAEQDTVIPSPRNIAKRSRGRVVEIRRACSSVRPSACNKLENRWADFHKICHGGNVRWSRERVVAKKKAC